MNQTLYSGTAHWVLLQKREASASLYTLAEMHQHVPPSPCCWRHPPHPSLPPALLHSHTGCKSQAPEPKKRQWKHPVAEKSHSLETVCCLSQHTPLQKFAENLPPLWEHKLQENRDDSCASPWLTGPIILNVCHCI